MWMPNNQLLGPSISPIGRNVGMMAGSMPPANQAVFNQVPTGGLLGGGGGMPPQMMQNLMQQMQAYRAQPSPYQSFLTGGLAPGVQSPLARYTPEGTGLAQKKIDTKTTTQPVQQPRKIGYHPDGPRGKKFWDGRYWKTADAFNRRGGGRWSPK